MSRFYNKSTGSLGEALAVELLQKEGYEILEKNWGSKWGEIDVIAKDKEVYVFVEVKTKVGEDFGSPEEMVNKKKLMQVQRMASTYYKAKYAPKRIDVVAVVLDREMRVMRINHYEAVY